MDNEIKNIPPVIHLAIDIMRKRFGGTKVEIVGDRMYRLPPSSDAPAGKLGIDIEVQGIRAFLGCSSNAEEMVHGTMGEALADEFIYSVIKQDFMRNSNKYFKEIDNEDNSSK